MKAGNRSLCPKRPGLSSAPHRPQVYPWKSFPSASVRKKMDDKTFPELSILTRAKTSPGRGVVKGITGPTAPAFSLIHKQHQLQAPPAPNPSAPSCHVQRGHFNSKVQQFNTAWSSATTFAAATSPRQRGINPGVIPDSPVRETAGMAQGCTLERLSIPSLSALTRGTDVSKQYGLAFFFSLPTLSNH